MCLRGEQMVEENLTGIRFLSILFNGNLNTNLLLRILTPNYDDWNIIFMDVMWLHMDGIITFILTTIIHMVLNNVIKLDIPSTH